MVITGVQPGASLGVYPLLNAIDKTSPGDDNDLLYISEGGSNILSLYKRTAPPIILPTTGNGNLNFNYEPDDGDMIARLRFIILISGEKNCMLLR